MSPASPYEFSHCITRPTRPLEGSCEAGMSVVRLSFLCRKPTRVHVTYTSRGTAWYIHLSEFTAPPSARKCFIWYHSVLCASDGKLSPPFFLFATRFSRLIRDANRAVTWATLELYIRAWMKQRHPLDMERIPWAGTPLYVSFLF